MKLILAAVHAIDADEVSWALTDRGFSVTRVMSSGGGQSDAIFTLLIGVQESHVTEVIGVIRDRCQARSRLVNPLTPMVDPVEFFVPVPVEVQVGGATVVVLPVERYERVA